MEYSLESKRPKERLFECPKCGAKYVNDIEAYTKHRVECSKKNPAVIAGLRQLGLNPDPYL